jgi:hypothetical protein
MLDRSTAEYRTIFDLDSYFVSCEEIEQGINSKEVIAFMDAAITLIKEGGVGVVLDLNDEMESSNGKNLLRRSLLQVHPNFDKLFAPKK